MKFIKRLEKQEACEEALEWAKGQKSKQSAWDNCHRADWMLWAWGHNVIQDSKQHKQLVLACCACAKTGLKFIKDKQVKYLVKHSLATTEGWARGEKSINEVIEARYKYFVSAAAAAAYYAANAAYAATDDAAYAVDNNTAKALLKMANIIRKMQPKAPKFL